MAYHVLLDVGGTEIKGRLEDNQGNKWPIREFPSCSRESQYEVIAHFCDICDTLRHDAKDGLQYISTIAMAFPGPFDYKQGIPLMRGLSKYEALYGSSLPNLMEAYWQSIHASSCDSRTQWLFINDVSAFALGMANKYCKNERVMCVCLGTGVGSAFLINGQISVQKEQGIPENGWIYPVLCGESTIDNTLSARGITQLAKDILGEELSPFDLSVRAQSGNSRALAVWKEYGRILSDALMPLAEKFQADTLFLGGKIARSSKLFDTILQCACHNKEIQIIVESETAAVSLDGLRMQLAMKG